MSVGDNMEIRDKGMPMSLEEYLETHAASPALCGVAETILHLSTAAVTVHRSIAAGRISETGLVGDSACNASGEIQKSLDVFADRIFLVAATASPVCLYGSEEQLVPIILGGAGRLALAIDPLDGSSNIETNIAVGTIFSLLPVAPDGVSDPRRVFEQPGDRQLAAGFFVYGAQLLLVVTVGSGTKTFIYADDARGFVATGEAQAIPPETWEYSVNASNRRYWAPGIKRYIEDAEAGEEGPRERNFGMRYAGSLVADTFRILQRGGVFLYPSDRRAGYRKGRLRHIYEANPIAFCIEQAGGAATDGQRRILMLQPDGLHARSPFVFGSRNEVDIIAAYASKDEAETSLPAA